MTMEIGETTRAQPFTGAGSRGAPQLETVMHLMWDRIEGLEADRRSLRRMIAFGFATVVLVAGVSGAICLHAAGSRNPRDLAVTDGAGRVRARLGVNSQSGATTLELLDEEGHTQAILAAGAAGPALSFYDRDGRAKLRIGLASKSPILDVVDAKGRRTTIDLTTPRPPAATVPARRTRSTSTVASRDRSSTPRFVDAKGRPCEPATLGCRRNDARAHFFGSAG
jgi:hypothetical protein